MKSTNVLDMFEINEYIISYCQYEAILRLACFKLHNQYTFYSVSKQDLYFIRTSLPMYQFTDQSTCHIFMQEISGYLYFFDEFKSLIVSSLKLDVVQLTFIKSHS